ncbi:hypothetical protein [Falsirhodobacter sp. 20TX0035]|uniref:hypothetical protein n=1 Tax=Falsirhodobacter sp. 20TX0035 TaxID=3022019 RepID=UPI00232E0A18|nr:hypothetical protein [Falsirhodobacter sp. 20TX0035]MDB6452496.1 hypothetical protein [Falsirhodobacter sp. 20TX0035]
MTVLALLTRIDAALDAGRFDEIAACAPLLEEAVDTLHPDDDLAGLRQRAQRLSSRLQSAAEGVRAARWRLADIRSMGQAGDRLVTYDGTGRKHDSGGAGLLTRRY